MVFVASVVLLSEAAGLMGAVWWLLLLLLLALGAIFVTVASFACFSDSDAVLMRYSS